MGELFAQACEADIITACFNLGVLYEIGKGVRQDNSREIEYYANACDYRYFNGCEALKNLKK